jgi:hypothetical protein
MDDEGKKQLMEEFKKVDGPKRLEMWEYACGQQVLSLQSLTFPP